MLEHGNLFKATANLLEVEEVRSQTSFYCLVGSSSHLEAFVAMVIMFSILG